MEYIYWQGETSPKKRKRKKRVNWFRLCLTSGLMLLVMVCVSAVVVQAFDKVKNVYAAVWTSPDMDFSKVYYYEADKENRYVAYQKEHPEFSAEDVVWRVNVGLDKPFYSNVKTITDFNAKLLLVNKYNRLPDDYVPANLMKLSSGQYVTEETKEAFEQMQADALVQGYTIRAASGYRSIDYQRDLYQQYLQQESQELVDETSARPGYSEHHTGQAIDLVGADGNLQDFANSQEAFWVAKNAQQYGFVVQYQKETEDVTGYKAEPWHITYVGVEIAMDMQKKGIKTLEEYKVKYIDHQP